MEKIWPEPRAPWVANTAIGRVQYIELQAFHRNTWVYYCLLGGFTSVVRHGEGHT